MSGSATGSEGARENGPGKELTEEELSAEKQRLIEDRKSELARISDRHDDLVNFISTCGNCS